VTPVPEPPTLEDLLTHSGLPGPRGNLTLLYRFAATATEASVGECLTFLTDDLSNSPEEFVAMCGIVGFCVVHRGDVTTTIGAVRVYAGHSSWRVREAVAMGIQEMVQDNLGEILDALEPWVQGTAREQRAVVATLAEPKLLKKEAEVARILAMFARITAPFASLEGALDDAQTSLRQALGYGWSVVVAALPPVGKEAFERLAGSQNKHLRWIVRENLKKNRLRVMDPSWVDRFASP